MPAVPRGRSATRPCAHGPACRADARTADCAHSSLPGRASRDRSPHSSLRARACRRERPTNVHRDPLVPARTGLPNRERRSNRLRSTRPCAHGPADELLRFYDRHHHSSLRARACLMPLTITPSRDIHSSLRARACLVIGQRRSGGRPLVPARTGLPVVRGGGGAAARHSSLRARACRRQDRQRHRRHPLVPARTGLPSTTGLKSCVLGHSSLRARACLSLSPCGSPPAPTRPCAHGPARARTATCS